MAEHLIKRAHSLQRLLLLLLCWKSVVLLLRFLLLLLLTLRSQLWMVVQRHNRGLVRSWLTGRLRILHRSLCEGVVGRVLLLKRLLLRLRI